MRHSAKKISEYSWASVYLFFFPGVIIRDGMDCCLPAPPKPFLFWCDYLPCLRYCSPIAKCSLVIHDYWRFMVTVPKLHCNDIIQYMHNWQFPLGNKCDKLSLINAYANLYLVLNSLWFPESSDLDLLLKLNSVYKNIFYKVQWSA